MVVADHSEAIQDRLTNITVRKAINILHYCFGCGEEDIRWEGNCITSIELLERHPELGDLSAERIIIRFWGGPPSAYATYDGTLYTFLADRIMWAVAHKRSDQINKFLGLKL